MPRTSASDLVARRLRERGHTGGRLADLQLDVVETRKDETGEIVEGEVILSAGGRWDRRRKRYIAAAEISRVVAVHPGQVEAVEWFDEWLGDHVEGIRHLEEERVYSLLLSGGQRAGKTWVALAVFAVAYALACPGAIVWIVCPSDRDHDEVDDILRDTMPRSWYRVLGSPKFRYALENGSRIFLRSAHEPEALKKGRADLIVMNEAQRVSERAFATCRARIADRAGLVVACANPPDKPIGEWVSDWYVEAEAGLRQSLAFYFNPYENPHVDHGPLRALEKELDPRTYDAVVLGKHVAAIDTVLYNWERTENERIPPDPELEITRQLLRYKEGREFDRVLGVDVQKQPMVAVEYRFFENPLVTTGNERLDWCHAWITAEVVLDGASEEDLAIAWLELGWKPARTLVVCDASGEWQFSVRKPEEVSALRQKVRGRGSFDVFKSLGYRYVVKPDRKQEGNPDILERVRATTSRICTKVAGPYGQRFLFADPRCRRTVRAIRKWRNKHGVPMRSSQHDHFGDAVSYPIHRLFPRRREPAWDPSQVKVLKRFEGRSRMKGW